MKPSDEEIEQAKSAKQAFEDFANDMAEIVGIVEGDGPFQPWYKKTGRKLR